MLHERVLHAHMYVRMYVRRLMAQQRKTLSRQFWRSLLLEWLERSSQLKTLWLQVCLRAYTRTRNLCNFTAFSMTGNLKGKGFFYTTKARFSGCFLAGTEEPYKSQLRSPCLTRDCNCCLLLLDHQGVYMASQTDSKWFETSYVGALRSHCM